jgi:hypothetical protein
MRAAPKAPPAVLSLEGWDWLNVSPDLDAEWQRFVPTDGNRLLFRLPAEGSSSLGRPMLCLRNGEVIGASATSQRNRRSLNAHLTLIFTNPLEATLPAAMCVRHLFWSMPLHRLYVQMPMVGPADQYVAMLSSVGFREEGRVRDFAVVNGESTGVVVMGVLRPEFEAWCQANEKRLAL